jgi:hypothetical protein
LLVSLRGEDNSPERALRNTLFYGPEVNDPTADKAGLLLTHMRRAGLLAQSLNPSRLGSLFRTDLFTTIRRTKTHLKNHEIQSCFEAQPVVA